MPVCFPNKLLHLSIVPAQIHTLKYIKMAKTKPQHRSPTSHSKDLLHTTNGTPKKSKRPQISIEELLTEAATLLQQSQPVLALPIAEKALSRLETESSSAIPLPPAICLVAEIQLELGDADSALTNFARAVNLDPEGSVVGADAFLWLAQLCEEGGLKSIQWFERATGVLRRTIAGLEDQKPTEEIQIVLLEAKGKLSDALCSMAEVYMTDLSLEPDAEAKCEALVTEALIVSPESPAALQTLASVRISQIRIEDARAALGRSLELWEDLPPENPLFDVRVPEFPTRISLARLLMEVEMETKGMTVLQRLVGEDDQSIEAWYLGGWCQVLLAEKGDEKKKTGAREWLKNSLRLYKTQEYEDERLHEHAVELVGILDKQLGIEEEEGDEDEWQDESGEEEEDSLDIEAADEDSDAEMT